VEVEAEAEELATLLLLEDQELLGETRLLELVATMSQQLVEQEAVMEGELVPPVVPSPTAPQAGEAEEMAMQVVLMVVQEEQVARVQLLL
jgi:hypothetical protein